MTFIYPVDKITHQSIVSKMFRGEFISIGKPEYDTLEKYREYYTSFFSESHGIDLLNKDEVFYCVKNTGNTALTGRILTMLSILVYELNNKGIEPVTMIRTKEFTASQISKYIEDSVQFSAFLRTNKVDGAFVNKMVSLGLAKRTDGEKFVFTRAIEVFLSELDDMAEQVSALNSVS